MEEKDSKRIITHEEMVNIKNKLEELVNSDFVDPDKEPTVSETTESKPQPTVEQVVEILKSIESEGFDDDATEWSEKYDDGKYWIAMRLNISPSKVEIITVWADEHFIVSETIGRVVIEGVENVAKLILALRVDIDDVDNLLDNLFEALDNRIPGNWDEDYYDPTEIIEKLNGRHIIKYKTVNG